MDSPGITVNPIKNMSGGTMFAEVFFDDVRVPVENRLGEEGEGWHVTITALAHERSGIAEVTGLQRSLESVRELARKCVRNGRPAAEDPRIRRRIAEADARIEAMRLNGFRFLTKQLRGEKLGSSRAPLARGADLVPDGGKWQHFALSWPEVVIGGGTPNIQKNIIAERILGLPKDP
jgi:alkylation response protein AidB-like acyl-CoA dehydrogenase